MLNTRKREHLILNHSQFECEPLPRIVHSQSSNILIAGTQESVVLKEHYVAPWQFAFGPIEVATS